MGADILPEQVAGYGTMIVLVILALAMVRKPAIGLMVAGFLMLLVGLPLSLVGWLGMTAGTGMVVSGLLLLGLARLIEIGERQLEETKRLRRDLAGRKAAAAKDAARA